MLRTSKNSNVLNSRDEIFLVITEESKFPFYCIILGDLRFIELPLFKPKSQFDKRRQMIVFDRIPVSSYIHNCDLQDFDDA